MEQGQPMPWASGQEEISEHGDNYNRSSGK